MNINPLLDYGAAIAVATLTIGLVMYQWNQLSNRFNTLQEARTEDQKAMNTAMYKLLTDTNAIISRNTDVIERVETTLTTLCGRMETQERELMEHRAREEAVLGKKK